MPPITVVPITRRATAPEPERRYLYYSAMLFDLEHPEQIEPFHRKDAPLLERDPLLFYRAGFFVLLGVSLFLLLKLLSSGVRLP